MASPSNLEDELQHHGGDLERAKALSDGVFAFALTLLVLDIHVPALRGAESLAKGFSLSADDRELLADLMHEVPRLMSYLMSFYAIAAYWMAHTLFFRMVGEADRRAIWRNVWFLCLVAVLPFPTALIGTYPGSRVAWVVYAANLIGMGLLLRKVFTYAAGAGLLKSDVKPRVVRYLRLRSLVLPIVFLVSIPVAVVAGTHYAELLPLAIPILSYFVGRQFKRGRG